MTFGEGVFYFVLTGDESLMPLVTKRGYSKPTAEDPIARKVLTDYGGAEITVEREDVMGTPMALVTILPGSIQVSATNLFCVVMHDLCEAGLIDPKEA